MVLVLASGRRIHERDLACNKQLDGLPDVRFGSVGIHFDARIGETHERRHAHACRQNAIQPKTNSEIDGTLPLKPRVLPPMAVK